MNDHQSGDNHLQLIREILMYLLKHPEAKDTAEGVLQYWLTKRPDTYCREEVETALEWLVANGMLTARRPSPYVFGLKKDITLKAKEFLQNTQVQDQGNLHDTQTNSQDSSIE